MYKYAMVVIWDTNDSDYITKFVELWNEISKIDKLLSEHLPEIKELGGSWEHWRPTNTEIFNELPENLQALIVNKIGETETKERMKVYISDWVWDPNTKIVQYTQ